MLFYVVLLTFILPLEVARCASWSSTPKSFNAQHRGRFNDRQLIVSGGDSRTAESALFHAIMGNYRSNVRPVSRINDTVNVSARLFPIKIQSLKERDEILSLTLRLQLGWEDKSLVWNPADYGGLDKIVVNAYDLWLPDLQIANSAEDMYQLMRDRQFAVKIHYNGEIWWHPTGSVKVRCELDLRYFPFDLQRCPITLESVIHTVQQLNLTVRQDRAPISFSMYTENGVWEMVLATGHTSSYFVSMQTSLSRVNFILYLHRRTSYYKLNIIFPCAMLSGLQLLTFLLPLNNQERVPQSTTILLSVVVFQTVVVEELPRTSNSLSLLSMYISLLTGISVASVADSVAIAYLISLRDRAFQVPTWFASFIRIICRGKTAAKHMPFKNVELFNNSRSSLVVKSSIVPNNTTSAMAPLAYMDDYGEVVGAGEVISRKNGKCQQHHCHNRTLSPVRNPDCSNFNGKQSRSRSHQQIKAKVDGSLLVSDNGYNTIPKAVENNYSDDVYKKLSNNELSKQRHHHHNNANTNGINCDSSSGRRHHRHKAEQASMACLYSLRAGHEIIFVRWYKVARIINAAVFTVCLLLITLVPIVLFIFLPPDVSQYKSFRSPAAATPSASMSSN